jgi:PadR family transcriptional regulator AphA
MTAIKLKPISFMVLGMLRLGAKSGYSIKRAADLATDNFWPVSLAQVYPELARLEQHGLVNRHEDPHGDLKRSAYELTEAGETALLSWLRSSVEAPPRVRSEGLLRLFFADALPVDDQLALVRRLRERNRSDREQLHEVSVKSTVGDIRAAGIRFPQIVRSYGESVSSHTEQWFGELESELKEKD